VLVPRQDFERLAGVSISGLSISGDSIAIGPGAEPDANGVFAWTPDAEQSQFARELLHHPSTRWQSAESIMFQLIAEGLRSVRERHNMTQQELANAIDVTQPHVSRLEQDLDGVPLRLFRKLADVFRSRGAR